MSPSKVLLITVLNLRSGGSTVGRFLAMRHATKNYFTFSILISKISLYAEQSKRKRNYSVLHNYYIVESLLAKNLSLSIILSTVAKPLCGRMIRRKKTYNCFSKLSFLFSFLVKEFIWLKLPPFSSTHFVKAKDSKSYFKSIYLCF